MQIGNKQSPRLLRGPSRYLRNDFVDQLAFGSHTSRALNEMEDRIIQRVWIVGNLVQALNKVIHDANRTAA